MTPARLLALWLRALADRVERGEKIERLRIEGWLVSGKVDGDRVGFSAEAVVAPKGTFWEDELRAQLKELG